MKLSPLLLLLLLFSCSQNNVLVTQRQPQVPALKFRDYNNILDISILNNDSVSPLLLKRLVISTAGTTRLNDIESAAVYYTGNMDVDISEKSELVSATNTIQTLVTFEISFELKPGENHFRVTYKLRDSADISGRVSAICKEVLMMSRKIKLPAPDTLKPQRTGVALRKHNDDGVSSFRIPGLVKTNMGSLFAVYDVRHDSKRDLQGNIDIGISRSTDGGSSWEPMVIALDMGEYGGLSQKFNGVSDGSLLVDRTTGIIYVAGLWMHGVLDSNGAWIKNLTDTSNSWNHQWRAKGSQPGFGIKQTSQFLIAKSTDDGKTWGNPVNLTRMCKKEEWWLWAPAPGNGITLENGTLVFPTQGRDKSGTPFSNISYSSDHGTTWKTSLPAYTNTTECAVVQLDDGSLMLNMRNNRNKNNSGSDNGRAIAVTTDMGATWTEHATSHSALNEPVCMGSLYKHSFDDNGTKRTILFFSNPDTKKGRHHITIKASTDNGASWPENYSLMLDEGTGNGYSCLTGIDNDHIGILYESSQADLVFQKIEVRDVVK